MACVYDKCDGSGWLLDENGSAVACDCRSRTIEKARNRGISSVVPPRYRGVSFDRPPVLGMDRKIVGFVESFVDSLESNLAEGRGLWFTGPKGTGKTTLAMLVSKNALERGFSTAIYSLPKLLAQVRTTYDQGSEQDYTTFFNRLVAVDLLHLDDLGAERHTEWVLEQLYSIINERYEQRRSVIITTNLDPSALSEQIGERTVSRLVEMCPDTLSLTGIDNRMVYQPQGDGNG